MIDKTNVIAFPRVPLNNLNPVTETDRNEIIGSLRTQVSEEIGDCIMQNIVSLFQFYGLIESSDDLNYQDTVFLEEALKAAIYRYKGIYHQLHPIIEEVVSMDENDDEAEDDDIKNSRGSDASKNEESVLTPA